MVTRHYIKRKWHHPDLLHSGFHQIASLDIHAVFLSSQVNIDMDLAGGFTLLLSAWSRVLLAPSTTHQISRNTKNNMPSLSISRID